MKNHIHTVSAFLKTLCAACAFLTLALLLCTLTACSEPDEAKTYPSLSAPAPSLSEQPPASPSPAQPADPSSVPPTQTLPASSEVASPVQSASPSEIAPQFSAQPSAVPSDTPASEPSPESSTQPGQTNSENNLQAILRGNAVFFSTDANQSLTISELNRAISDDSSISAKVIKFAVVDLDGDSEREVVLWFEVNEYNAFFEILRQQNGQIYGDTLGYRAFHDLKHDGTFSFSSGAADNGFGWISFADMTYTVNKVGYSESAYDANNELTVNYYVNGQPASESEYLSAMEEQMDKINVL